MNDSPDASIKRCYSCTEILPATPEFFSRNKHKKDGLHDACKRCDSARRKAYTEAHREQEYQSRKRYRDNNVEPLRESRKLYQETHPKQMRERSKRYVETHREQYLAYQKQYHQEHLEEAHEQGKQHYLTNREQYLERQRRYLQTEQGKMVDKAHRWKRKAQKRASEGSYTAQQLQEQLKRQKSRCYYCKVKLGKIYHVDHVVPLARGGSNDISNIVIACPTCNMKKHTKLPHEWPEGNRLL